jgi:hypothetical protein
MRDFYSVFVGLGSSASDRHAPAARGMSASLQKRTSERQLPHSKKARVRRRSPSRLMCRLRGPSVGAAVPMSVTRAPCSGSPGLRSSIISETRGSARMFLVCTARREINSSGAPSASVAN